MKEIIEQKLQEQATSGQIKQGKRWMDVFYKHMTWIDDQSARFNKNPERFGMDKADGKEVANLLGKAMSAMEDVEMLVVEHIDPMI